MEARAFAVRFCASVANSLTCSGSGKSSTVNALLGKPVAVVDGSGKAVTAFVIEYHNNEEDNIASRLTLPRSPFVSLCDYLS
jgi:hypothetical protein